jgi:hypothetical protein
MAVVARIPLNGGGAILVEGTLPTEGPVKVGRVADAIRDIPMTLQAVLQPVTDAASVVLEQLRTAGPTEVEVAFGVNLASEAGAVITKVGVASHLDVRMIWKNVEADRGADDA